MRPVRPFRRYWLASLILAGGAAIASAASDFAGLRTTALTTIGAFAKTLPHDEIRQLAGAFDTRLGPWALGGFQQLDDVDAGLLIAPSLGKMSSEDDAARAATQIARAAKSIGDEHLSGYIKPLDELAHLLQRHVPHADMAGARAAANALGSAPAKEREPSPPTARDLGPWTAASPRTGGLKPAPAAGTDPRLLELASSLVRQELDGELRMSWISYSGVMARHSEIDEIPRWNDLIDVASTSLLPWMELQAKNAGFHSFEEYSRHVLDSNDSAAAAQRAALARTLGGMMNTGGRDISAFFRDVWMWRQAVPFFHDLIEEKIKKGDRSIRVKSIGISRGYEPYSLAVTIDRALRAQGQDPDEWGIVIEAYDKDIESLWATWRGIYIVEPPDRAAKSADGLVVGTLPEQERYLDSIEEDVFRVKERYRRWIRPIYLDLDHPELAPLVLKDKGNLLFANHVISYVRGSKNKDYWTALFDSAQWADRSYPAMVFPRTSGLNSGSSPYVIGPSDPITNSAR